MENMNLSDVHNILCEELCNLRAATGENLSTECERARSITGVASAIIENSKVVLKAQEIIGEYSTAKDVNVPEFLIGKPNTAIEDQHGCA